MNKKTAIRSLYNSISKWGSLSIFKCVGTKSHRTYTIGIQQNVKCQLNVILLLYG